MIGSRAAAPTVPSVCGAEAEAEARARAEGNRNSSRVLNHFASRGIIRNSAEERNNRGRKEGGKEGRNDFLRPIKVTRIADLRKSAAGAAAAAAASEIPFHERSVSLFVVVVVVVVGTFYDHRIHPRKPLCCEQLIFRLANANAAAAAADVDANIRRKTAAAL